MTFLQSIAFEAACAMRAVRAREDWLIWKIRPFISANDYARIVESGKVWPDMLRRAGLRVEESKDFKDIALYGRDGMLIGKWTLFDSYTKGMLAEPAADAVNSSW